MMSSHNQHTPLADCHSLSSLLLITTWFGLVTGLAELSIRAVQIFPPDNPFEHRFGPTSDSSLISFTAPMNQASIAASSRYAGLTLAHQVAFR